MKKTRIVIAILLAITLLLVPTVALAGDPPDTTVTVVVVSPGDVEGQFDLSAGGDLTVGINGVDLNAIVAAGIAAGRVNDGDEFRYHLVTTNRDNILFIARRQEDIIAFLNTLGYEAALAKEINLAQTQALNWIEVGTKKQDRAIGKTQAELESVQLQYEAVLVSYDELLEVANHKTTTYANEVSQLRREQAEMERMNLFVVIGLVAGMLVLSTVVGYLHRKLVLIKRG